MGQSQRRPPLAALAAEARSNPWNVFWSHWLAAALIVVGVADAATTEIALSTGHASEANPFVRGLQDALGRYWIAPKMAMHGFLAGAVVYYPNRATLIGMSLVATIVLLVSINNFLIYKDIVDDALRAWIGWRMA